MLAIRPNRTKRLICFAIVASVRRGIHIMLTISHTTNALGAQNGTCTRWVGMLRIGNAVGENM